MRPIRPWTVAAWLLVAWLLLDGQVPLPWLVRPGPRVVVVVMESAQVTPQQARLYTALRSSPQAQQWREKGHQVYLLDKDQRTIDDKPAEWLTRWPQWQQQALPVLMIGTPDGRLLYTGALPPSIDEVQQRLAQHGG